MWPHYVVAVRAETVTPSLRSEILHPHRHKEVAEEEEAEEDNNTEVSRSVTTVVCLMSSQPRPQKNSPPPRARVGSARIPIALRHSRRRWFSTWSSSATMKWIVVLPGVFSSPQLWEVTKTTKPRRVGPTVAADVVVAAPAR